MLAESSRKGVKRSILGNDKNFTMNFAVAYCHRRRRNSGEVGAQ